MPGAADHRASTSRPMKGWLYLAALLDTYSRFIVDWVMSRYRDEALVTDALCMALARRKLPQPANLIQHTDRGSPYPADESWRC